MFDLIDRGRNILRQIRAPDEKIFFIGFNKCGTTSLHHLVTRHAIRSVHWDNGQLARTIETLSTDKPALRSFLSHSTAYSDITSLTESQLIEGNKHFRIFHELFPDAYFIFNDRQMEDWIKSRSSHRRGTFLSRNMSAWRMDADAVKDTWRQNYQMHTNDVLKHFNGHERFLHFRIDQDPINALIDFLSPSFVLRAHNWKRRNTTKL